MAVQASSSPEFARFFGAALLLGNALTFGAEDNSTQGALNAVSAVPGLLNANMTEVLGSYTAWAHDTLALCGAGHISAIDNASDAGAGLRGGAPHRVIRQPPPRPC